MKKLNRTVFLVITIFVFFFLLGGRKLFLPYNEAKNEYRYFTLFSEIASLVKSKYVEKVEAVEKFPGAYSAMVNSIDPFSSYLDADKTEIFHAYQTGNVYNCGIYGAKVRKYFYVSDVDSDSPAHKAGLKSGDIIKAVNGKSLYALSYWEMYFSLLSTKPQSIEVELFKKIDEEPETLKIDMQPAKIGSTVQVLPGNITLLKLSRFDDAAVSLVKSTLTSTAKPLKLVIDLRKYDGGNLKSFNAITKLLFKNKVSLSLKTKIKTEKLLPGTPNVPRFRATVIINKSTRMYGELLAALFKAKHAVAGKFVPQLVGSNTLGFVSKLRFIPLEDRSSLLITEGLFLLNGKPTASKKIQPDVAVEDKDSAKIIDTCISILNGKKSNNKPSASG
ncbi:MAG: PDZ domain-containing protein [bacterium]|nr:PDZ domain-containing protein [bacterium]